MITVTLNDVKRSLCQTSPMNIDLRSIVATIKLLKKFAAADSDESLAKELWCFQQVATIYMNYLRAFDEMKAGRYYKAWCLLERVEISLHSLERHFEICDEDHWIKFIKRHVPYFQSLYPYRVFLSPAMVIHEKRCSICDAVIGLRTSCAHVTGEIYHGEMRAVRITKADIQEISLVTNPVQKYSVAFAGNKGEDNYNYGMVANVIKRLGSPFDAWTPHWTTRFYPHSHFRGVGRNDSCPCRSGLKYKKCCLEKAGISLPHCHITFEAMPSLNLLRH